MLCCRLALSAILFTMFTSMCLLDFYRRWCAYDNMPGMPKFIFNVNGVRARLQSLHSVARTPQPNFTKYCRQCGLWSSLKERKRYRIASKAFHIQFGPLVEIVCMRRSDNFTRADLRNAQNPPSRSELSTEMLAAACGYKWITFNNVCLLRYAIDIIYGRR